MTQTNAAGGGASEKTLNLMLALMVVGIALSGYLSWVHLRVTYADDTVGGLCNLSRQINCNVAAGSVWSEVAGIPIAILGAAFYLAVLVALMVWQSRGQANRWLP
ncbi:MAG: vitamin K epoxide reductase family protein, partial [Myxococcota bacterium]